MTVRSTTTRLPGATASLNTNDEPEVTVQWL